MNQKFSGHPGGLVTSWNLNSEILVNDPTGAHWIAHNPCIILTFGQEITFSTGQSPNPTTPSRFLSSTTIVCYPIMLKSTYYLSMCFARLAIHVPSTTYGKTRICLQLPAPRAFLKRSLVTSFSLDFSTVSSGFRREAFHLTTQNSTSSRTHEVPSSRISHFFSLSICDCAASL